MINIRSLGKQYGDLHVLSGIDLSIQKGEWITITGPSGSGKTTLLNLVSGLDHPTTGQVEVLGKTVSQMTEAEACQFRLEVMGFIFQKYHLVPYLSAVENVMLAQYFHSIHDEQEARAALERVGLGKRAHHRPSELSGGEQQRVCIARALINEPQLVFADEPTGNLDRANSEIILNLLRDLHQKEGFTIVMVTHDPFVEKWSERVLSLEDGRVIADESRSTGV